MEIDLDGATIALDGEPNPIVEAALAALRANGGRIVQNDAAQPADILLISCPLLPEPADPRALLLMAQTSAAAMAERGSGRILFLLSALAGMPMRRHPSFSADMAAVHAGMRTLAMEFGPKVLANAVGFGAIEDGAMVSGDIAQLSHTPVGRAGTIAEAVAAVLFFCDPLNSYTTGQMLVVDGGWSAGYGRNF